MKDTIFAENFMLYGSDEEFFHLKINVIEGRIENHFLIHVGMMGDVFSMSGKISI